MKKHTLFLWFVVSCFVGWAQNNLQKMQGPVQFSSPQLYTSPAKKNEIPQVKTLLCRDTIRYPEVKEFLVGPNQGDFYIFELWTADLEATSQTFLLSGATLSINGIEFYGRRRPGSGTNLQVRGSIYNVDANYVPTTLLGSATVTFNDTLYQYRYINFGTAINVSNNYAVVLEPISPNGILQYLINDYLPNQPQDENLCRYKSEYYPNSANGANPAIWVSTPVLTTGDAVNFPGTGHFEPLVAPIITYTINTNFTTSPAAPCVGQVVNFTNTTTPTGVLTNRMYNFNQFLNHFFLEPDSTYAWDADPLNPANPIIWSQNASYTYPTAGGYNPTLFTLGGFWNSCVDFQANPITINGVPGNTSPISGNNTVCAGTSQTYSVINDPTATSYTWTLPPGWTGSSTSNSITVTVGNNGGNIEVTANNNCGPSNQTILNVTVNQDNATFTYPNNTICSGSPNPTPTVFTPGTFSSSPSGLVFVSNTSGEIDMNLSNENSYTVTYTTSGTCPNSSSQTITITGSPDATFTYANNSYCVNNANPLPQFAMGASPGTFSATPSGISFVNPNTGQINLSASAPNNYTITNTIPAQGVCPQVTATFNVTIYALPNISVSPSSPSICVGDSITLVANNGISYSWSPSINLNTTTGNTVIANPTSDITYVVVGIDNNGCSNSASVTVNVNDLPTVTASAFSDEICNGFSTELTGGGALSYDWTPATGLSSTSGANVTASPTSDITYTVVGTDGNGCTNSATVSITVNDLPTVTLSSFNSVCVYDASFALTGGSPSGGSYSGPGVSAGEFNPATAGIGTHTIVYVFTDANNCTGNASETITVLECLGLDNASFSNLQIMPNPASDFLNIGFQLETASDIQIRLISMDGKMVLSRMYPNQLLFANTLEISHLATGSYILQIESNQGIISKKIIKQ